MRKPFLIIDKVANVVQMLLVSVVRRDSQGQEVAGGCVLGRC